MSRADNLALANAMREQSLALPPAPDPGPPPDIDAEIARKMSLYRGEGTSLDYAQALRGWEEENLPEAIGLGFVPGVGQLYGAASAAAALRDPEASMLDKGLSVAGMLPFGSILKALRGGGGDKAEIIGHHGGRDWEGPPKPVQIGGEGNWSEGPGFYLGEDPSIGSAYARSSFKNHYAVKPDPTSKPLVRQYEIDDDIFDNQFVNLQAAFESQPEQVKEALIKLYPGDTDFNKLARYHNEFKWPMGSMKDPKVADLARQQALAVGIRGNDAPWTEYFVSFDPEADLQELESAVPPWWTIAQEVKRLDAVGKSGGEVDPKQYERLLRALQRNPNASAYNPDDYQSLKDTYDRERYSAKGVSQYDRRRYPDKEFRYNPINDELPGGKIYDFPAALRADPLDSRKLAKRYEPAKLEDYKDELGVYPDNYDPNNPGATRTPAEEVKEMMKNAPPLNDDLLDPDGAVDIGSVLKLNDFLKSELMKPDFLGSVKPFLKNEDDLAGFLEKSFENLGYSGPALEKVLEDEAWVITGPVTEAVLQAAEGKPFGMLPWDAVAKLKDNLKGKNISPNPDPGDAADAFLDKFFDNHTGQ